MVLAASQPERVEALVLLATVAAFDWKPDMETAPELFDRMWAIIDEACARWGEGVLASAMAPTWAANSAYQPLLPAIESACMSPGMARSVLQGYHGLDARDAAASIHVPTLVLHSVDDGMLPVEYGHDVTRRIEGATFVPLRGDHFAWIHNSETLPDVIEEFLTGEPHRPHDVDRVLTTIVFTDIVESTRRLAGSGDAPWRTLLAEHDRRMDELLVRFDGQAVKHLGDGRLVRFARPARAVRFAAAMTDAARSCGFDIRAGIHIGECEITGRDLIGMAVNIGARVAALALPGEVLVTSTVKDVVVGSGLHFSAKGGYELKGAPDRWSLYRYDGDRPGALVESGYETDVRHAIASPE